MTKTFIIDKGQKPTDEQLKEIEEAQKNSITFDKDCEELSPAMMKAFKSAVKPQEKSLVLKKAVSLPKMEDKKMYLTGLGKIRNFGE